MKTDNDFYAVLFEPDESTCFGRDTFGTEVLPVADWESFRIMRPFFSINPLKERRLDANVVAYRNILVEFDKIPLDEQLAYVASIGMPYSTCVYSGNKSYHFIISLADARATELEWRFLVGRIFRVLGDQVDKANKNPSRFSRRPGAWRMDTDKYQDLISVRGRVPFAEVNAWLTSKGSENKTPEEMAKPTYTPAPRIDTAGKPEWFSDKFLYRLTRDFLKNGAAVGDRHYRLLRAAHDFARVGKSQSEAIRRLEVASDKPHSEVVDAVRYCYRLAAQEQSK